MKSHRLAKLTRPRLFGMVPRERLFRLLDERLVHPALWIAGPPGAGKTTLTAGYLESRRRPAIWYQVDGGDNDPATFFYYLGIAAGGVAGTRGGQRLPVLTPEYLPDLQGFTRRFFRNLFARLPRGSLLVLDNYQELPQDAATHAIVTCALQELPRSIGCVIASRTEPLPEFARLVTTQWLSSIGWNDLRLTEDEAIAIAAARRVTDRRAVATSYRRSGGWVTGLILTLGPSDGAVRPGTAPAEQPESLFNYFVGVLFSKLRAETREVLLATAMLPRMTATVAALVSQVERAGSELRELYERNYFVDCHQDGEPNYQLHALFREFLLERLQRDFTAAQRRELARRSARALAGVDELEAAAALYSEAGDWQEAIAHVLAIAPSLLAQGRWQTLQQRIAALPPGEIERVPWLRYWLGASELAVDISAARSTLIRAFEGFEHAGDTLGQMLAASGIVECYCATYDDFRPGRRWVTVLEALLSANPAFPDVQVELQVLSSLVFGTLVGIPENPRLPAYARRLMPLIEQPGDPNIRVAGTVALCNYYSWIGELEEARRAGVVAAALVAHPSLLPIRRVPVCLALAFNAEVRADYDETAKHFDAALGVIEEHRLAFLEPFVRLCDTWHRLACGDYGTVAGVLHRVGPALSPSRRADIVVLHHVSAWLALLEHDFAKTELEARAALAIGREIGWKHVRALHLFCLAEALVERGEHDDALACVRLYRSEFASLRAPMHDFQLALIEAYAAERRRDDTTCANALRLAFATGRAHGYMNSMLWSPRMMTRLAAFALEHAIETEYVTSLVRRRNLTCDSPIETWPWPIRVYTLGRFVIVRDDEPVTFAGKAQHKPLQLLKAIIALGGKDVPASKLAGILWPAPPDDGGHKALEIAVHRLRKLLGSDDAIVVAGRHLTLDPRRVWVDAWALERRLSALTPPAGEALCDLEAMQGASAAVLDLYRGHFLAGDIEEAWQMPLRNRLSGRFQRFVLSLGEHWEANGRWSSAAETYARVTELDPLAESFYRRQMICLREMGRRAEAIEVFRRCRHALSVTLGIAPSGETAAVYREILGSTRAVSRSACHR